MIRKQPVSDLEIRRRPESTRMRESRGNESHEVARQYAKYLCLMGSTIPYQLRQGIPTMESPNWWGLSSLPHQVTDLRRRTTAMIQFPQMYLFEIVFEIQLVCDWWATCLDRLGVFLFHPPESPEVVLKDVMRFPRQHIFVT